MIERDVTEHELTGLVVASYGPRGKVDTGTETAARYVVKGRKLRVVCGDRVALQKQSSGAEWLVTAVLPRTNVLERPDSRGRSELIAANLDCLALVLAPEPRPDFYIADRYLCAAELLPADILIIWNKSELVTSVPLELKNYRTLGYTVIATNAVNGDGVAELKQHLAKAAPQGPWLYPEDQISDAPMRHLAAEITREKLTLRLHQELPYASTVETTAWKKLRRGGIRIEQTVYVMRDTQKKIVLGKQGQTIKNISMEARKELSDILGVRVDLFLFVKVRSKWGDDPERYQEMGLDFPEN